MFKQEYEIVSVKPTDPPGGMDGTGWHCYIIAQGKNTIRGYQQGNIKAVTGAVEEIVERLNERRFGKKGRAQPSKPAQAKKAGRQ